MMLSGRVPEVPAGTLIATQVLIPEFGYAGSSAQHRILAFFLSCRSSPERSVVTRAFRENKVLQEERDLVEYKTYFDSMFETSELSSDSDCIYYWVEGLNGAMPRKMGARLSLKAKIVEDATGLGKAATIAATQLQYDKYMTAAGKLGLPTFLSSDRAQRAAALQGLAGETELHEVAAKQVNAVTQPLLERMAGYEEEQRAIRAAQEQLGKKQEQLETAVELGFSKVMDRLDNPRSGG